MVNSLISIIVPVYNIEQYISKCINSIICQTYSNIEIILVDDGSTDSSGVICDEFAKNDLRIKVIHKNNEGLVRARKSGLNIARGKYIGFVDGDDYIEPDMYEKLLEVALKNNADMVHTGYESVGILFLPCSDSEIILNMENRLIFFEKYVLGIKKKTILSPSIWSKIFNANLIRKCYEQVPDDCCYGEDFICLSYCFFECKKIVLRQRAFYHYVIRDDSLTHIHVIDKIAKECNLYKQLNKVFRKYNVSEYLDEKAKEYFGYVIWNLTREMNKESIFIQNYLFPNINMLKGKRIVLYGAGKVGRDYYTQICRYPECNIVLWVDKNDREYHFPFYEVKEVANIKQCQYDMILIAVKDQNVAIQIKNELIENRVDEQKIIWMEPQSVY